MGKLNCSRGLYCPAWFLGCSRCSFLLHSLLSKQDYVADCNVHDSIHTRDALPPRPRGLKLNGKSYRELFSAELCFQSVTVVVCFPYGLLIGERPAVVCVYRRAATYLLVSAVCVVCHHKVSFTFCTLEQLYLNAKTKPL